MSADQPKEFSGKTVIVTGAASGLGKATAIAFAKAGADQVLVDVDAAGLAATAEELAQYGTGVEIAAADLLETANCAKVVAAGIARFGRLDALLNVAAAFRFTPLDQLTPETFDRLVGVNLKAPLFLIQAAMPHLIASEGAVVNVASAAGFIGHAYLSLYSSTKAGLIGMTKSLSMEYAHSPVRINALAPGPMATPMAMTAQLPEGMNFELMARVGGVRGMTQPEELTELMLFLASPRASAVHGTCFVADRGVSTG